MTRRPFFNTLFVVAASLMFSVAACGGGGSDATEPAPLARPASVERDLLPATIDPAITTSTEPHVAINPSATMVPVNKLFVFLPGTSAVPSLYRQVLRSGARRGFHTLGLNYPNATSVGSLCAASADSCFWDVRREVITGVDYSGLVSVGPADSIVTRLTKAIGYLQQHYPAEGWGQFLANGQVDWSKVIVAGHSQGGGHAGVMAKLYAMNRAVYFASPADWGTFSNAPASWMSLPNLTPASRQFGIVHVQDPLVPYSKLSVIWPTLGMAAFGPAVSVDSTAAPFGGSHMLTTNLTPNEAPLSASPFHGATVLDAVTPLDASGVPVLDPVWGYLAFQ